MNRQPFLSLIGPVFAFALAVVATPGTASAARDLDNALNRIVERVQGYLGSRGDVAVSVGNFAGPPSSSAGIRIKAALTDRLKTAGVEVVKLGRLQVRGSFVSESEPTPLVKVIAEMVDENGVTLGEFQERISVDNIEDVVNLLGTTTDLTPKVSAEGGTTGTPPSLQEKLQQRDEQLGKDLVAPAFALTGTAVSAADSSPYRVELVLRDAGGFSPVPVENRGGLAVVNLQKGQEYVIKLHNSSDIDVGVKVTIDGVNTFEFSQNADFRNLGMWMVPAGKIGTVEGWHISNSESLSFLLTDVPDSAVASLQRETTTIGTITASFFPAWTGDNVPEVELSGRTKGDIGTGLGAKVASAYETVTRHFGKTLLAAVSVRYEKPDPPGDLPAESAPN